MKYKDRLISNQQKAQQRADYLIQNDQFQKAVLRFRSKWNISKKGLKKINFRTWEASLKTSGYAPTEEDIELEVEYRKRVYNSSYKTVLNYDKYLQPAFIDKSDITITRALCNSLGKILIDHKLSPGWFEYIEEYLLFNKRNSRKLPVGVRLVTSIDKNTGQEFIELKITESITKEDLMVALKSINELQAQLPYFKVQKNMLKPTAKRNSEVFKLWETKNVNKMKAILDYLDDSYPKKNGDIHTENDVYKYLGEHRRNILN